VKPDIDLFSGIPCVIFLHGNASSQLEGQFLIPHLCKRGIALYCFDFPGCGESGGEYISLGYNERIDCELVINYLHKSYRFSRFVVWGRSMGAATSLLIRHPLLMGRIIDSSYTSIKDVCYSIAKSMGVPSIVISPALWWLKLNIMDIAEFDISTVSPLESVQEINSIPALFGHADDDEFVPYDQGYSIFQAYNNHNKEFMQLHGGHNGRRPIEWIQKGCDLIFSVFDIQTNSNTNEQSETVQSAPHFRTFNDMISSI